MWLKKFLKKISLFQLLINTVTLSMVINKVIFHFFFYLLFFKGYNYRRSRSKPKVFTEEEKERRLLFALNNLNNDFRNTVFVDECSIQTRRHGIYHNRLKSSRPRVRIDKPKSVDTVNVWGGISYYGTTQFSVIFLFLWLLSDFSFTI